MPDIHMMPTFITEAFYLVICLQTTHFNDCIVKVMAYIVIAYYHQASFYDALQF